MNRLPLLLTVLCAAITLGVGPAGAGQAMPEVPAKVAQRRRPSRRCPPPRLRPSTSTRPRWIS